MGIGERLRKWRKDSNLTMVEISNQTGIAHGAMSAYERELTTISVKSLVLLMENYDIDIVWILTGKENEDFLTSEEKELIRFFRRCNQEGKTAVKTTAAALSVSTDTGTKSSESSSSKIG